MDCAIYRLPLRSICKGKGKGGGKGERRKGKGKGKKEGKEKGEGEEEKRRRGKGEEEERCYSGSRHLPKIVILRPSCAIHRRYLFIYFGPSIFRAVYINMHVYIYIYIYICVCIYHFIFRCHV